MVAVIHTKVFFYKNVGNCNKAYKGKQLEYCLKYFQLHSCKQNLSVAIVQTKVPSYKLCTQKLSQLWRNFAIFFFGLVRRSFRYNLEYLISNHYLSVMLRYPDRISQSAGWVVLGGIILNKLIRIRNGKVLMKNHRPSLRLFQWLTIGSCINPLTTQLFMC